MKKFLMLVGLATIVVVIAVLAQNILARKLVVDDANLVVDLVDEDGDLLGVGFDPAALFGDEEIGYLTLHMQIEIGNSGPLSQTVEGVEFAVSLMADSDEVLSETGSEALGTSIDAGSSEEVTLSFRLGLEDAFQAGSEFFEADELEVVVAGSLEIVTWFTGTASIPFEVAATVELPGANLLDQIDLNIDLPSF